MDSAGHDFDFGVPTTQETRMSILMDKVEELYQKLADQIHQNEALSEENRQLKQKMHQFTDRHSVSQVPSTSTLPENNSTLFSLLLQKVTSLQGENRRLKQSESMCHNQYENTASYNYSKRSSCLVRPSPSYCSVSYLSNHDENRETCYSPRVSNLPFHQKHVQRKSEIDRLWMSPSRQNLQKIIHSNKMSK